MATAIQIFDWQFAVLSGFKPLDWQRRLFEQLVNGDLPSALDLPTGLGKTSVIAIWLIARAHGANLPRRLVYVVDRRAVVDQATTEAEKLREALEGKAEHFARLDESARAQASQTATELKRRLGFSGGRELPISTLRGAHVDNREWLDDPSAPAIIVGTVDMIGSRLLFEGYGVSRKMRPYQAGLLGVDALIVLDEAHLVPPFAHLLHAIEQDVSFPPNDNVDRALLPRFVSLPLSATQRDAGGNESGRGPFRLEEKDWKTDSVAKRRLEAKKRLRFEPLPEKMHDQQLAEAAWELATKNGKFFRVVVFCDRRDKSDDGGGPSAQGVAEAINDLAKGDRKAGRAKVDIHEPELLIGARRVYERELAAERLRELGFIGERKPLDRPAFLVATAAGEVGVDIDADHMVSDLVAWERMVQRLGRVNRRGEGDAEIRVFWRKPSVKDASAPTEAERRALTAFASKDVIENLSQSDGAFDASPGALRHLAQCARKDEALKTRIDAATTPEPLRPALNRALVDAWSMTSLQMHTGRPEVARWLRGWVEEKPQTIVMWRKYVPLRIGESGQETLSTKKQINKFFDAAPPHESEKLETETSRVAEWLHDRADMLLQRKPRKENVERAGSEFPADEADGSGAVAQRIRELQRDDIVALILSPNAEYERRLTLSDLAQDRKGRARENFHEILAGRILVIDARLGGLATDGLLNEEADSDPPTPTRPTAGAKQPKSAYEWQPQMTIRAERKIGGSRIISSAATTAMASR